MKPSDSGKTKKRTKRSSVSKGKSRPGASSTENSKELDIKCDKKQSFLYAERTRKPSP